jgi:hypothetical protein
MSRVYAAASVGLREKAFEKPAKGNKSGMRRHVIVYV